MARAPGGGFCYCEMVHATTLLERLKTDAALEGLAGLAVEALLETQVGQWLPPEVSARHARRLLEAWVAAPQATEVLSRVVEATVAQLSAERRALKDTLAPQACAVLREVIARPFSPDRTLVLTIIDRGPIRQLVREILLEAVLDFARKASAPMAGMAKGLGALARFAGETVRSRSGGLGSLVGAVGGEVERQLEKRAVEFVDATLAGVFGQLADAFTDPRRAAEAAELRVALFDGVLELTSAQLSRELVNADIPGGAEVLRAGLARWLAAPQAEAQLGALAARATGVLTKQTTGELLAELGLREVVRAAAQEYAVAGLRQLVGTPAFERWLTTLV